VRDSDEFLGYVGEGEIGVVVYCNLLLLNIDVDLLDCLFVEKRGDFG